MSLVHFYFTDETAQRMPLNLQLKPNWPNLNNMKKFFSTSHKNFSGYSYNKIHRASDSTSRYVKLCLILAVEESACFRTLSHLLSKSCLGEPTIRKTCFLFTVHSNPCFPQCCWTWCHLSGKKIPRKNMSVLAMWKLKWIHRGTELRLFMISEVKARQ